jgi:acyl carrier protein
LDIVAGVQSVLRETLSLGDRALELNPDSELLGAVPELDSQAVLSVLVGIEEQFGIVIDDDEVDAELFTTLGTLAALVERKLKSN